MLLILAFLSLVGGFGIWIWWHGRDFRVCHADARKIIESIKAGRSVEIPEIPLGWFLEFLGTFAASIALNSVAAYLTEIRDFALAGCAGLILSVLGFHFGYIGTEVEGSLSKTVKSWLLRFSRKKP